MKLVSAVLILTIALLALAHGYEPRHQDPNWKQFTDESTFSNINDIRTQHYDLELDLDFDRRVVTGKQSLVMQTQQFGVKEVRLDISDLTIFNVTDYYGNHLNYTIQDPNPELGQLLSVNIPTKWFPYEKYVINITYETSPDAGALTWLSKEQTAGKKLPYTFTQCESIYCRSIAPLQDSPSIKSTYNLHFTTPIDIVVKASGNLTHEYIDEEKRHTFFEMIIPVESYLLAFAGGNIVEAQVGPRTFVLSEPEWIEKVKAELDQLENALITAEDYFTPYIWGVYKVLILPPSFPFGGMENPLLTFMSPTHIVGDKSSFSVFVHEINHSWFGNLVTNENWSHFWLNEGFTRWAERKVDSILFGEDFSKVSAKLGNETMYAAMLDYGLNSTFSSLTPIFNGRHPDKAFSSIPYEKGFQFVYYLEHLVQPENFQKFLREYINEFYQKSISSEDFRAFFEGFVVRTFGKHNATEIFNQIDWDAWLKQPGLPPVIQDFETEEYNQAIGIAQNYIDNQVSIPEAKALYDSWDVNLKNLFITQLIKARPVVSPDVVAIVDADLHISEELNSNIISKWLQVDIRSGHQPSPFTIADEFVGSVGKTSAVSPIYASMNVIDRDVSWSIYQKHRSFYHPITRDAIEDLFKGTEPKLVSY